MFTPQGNPATPKQKARFAEHVKLGLADLKRRKPPNTSPRVALQTKFASTLLALC